MDQASLKKIRMKIFLLIPFSILIIAATLILIAGSIYYWPGWLFCSIITLSTIFNANYFLKKSPEFLERRMKYKEKEVEQKIIIKISIILFMAAFIIPGLDFRFGWSSVPTWLIIVSNLIIIAGYYLMFLSFKENTFAGRTVEIFKKQKVISSGPYSIIRHPMYAGIIPVFLAMGTSLGSYWAMIPLFGISLLIIFRTLNEEKVLREKLPGYKDYCKRVRFRLIPFIWMI